MAAIGATATLLRESLGMTIGGSSITASFPPQQPGLMYLTEGGTETEIMYKYGFELPEFAMFPLLDQPAAVAELRGVYTRYLDTAARHGFGVVMAGSTTGQAPTGPICSGTRRRLCGTCSSERSVSSAR